MKSRKIASKLGAVLTAATLISSMGLIPAMAATNEQTIGIKGTVSAVSTLDITVPVQPIEFSIGSDGNFSSSPKQILNHTSIPVYAYITEVYGASGDYPNIVASNTYDNWDGIDHNTTINNIALKLNDNELSTIYQANSTNKSDSGNYITLGAVAADSGELTLQLSGKNGKNWQNAQDIVFTYTANMLFITIEGNFGSGGSGGSITEYVSSSYATYASAAESSGYTTLEYAQNNSKDFMIDDTSTDISTLGIKIDYVGWKDNTDGTIELYVLYDASNSTDIFTFGQASSSYNNYAGKQSNVAGSEIIFKETIAKADLQDSKTNGGLNVKITNTSGNTIFQFIMINDTALQNIIDNMAS